MALRNKRGGAGLIAVGAAAGLAVSVFDYYTPASGIDGSGGAQLVIASSGLVLLASLVLMGLRARGSLLRGALTFLILAGIAGTGAAAYFLESGTLIGAMALCLVGWFSHILSGRVS